MVALPFSDVYGKCVSLKPVIVVDGIVRRHLRLNLPRGTMEIRRVDISGTIVLSRLGVMGTRMETAEVLGRITPADILAEISMATARNPLGLQRR